MTEEKWLNEPDPGEMSDALSELPLTKAGERQLSRKVRLFCCAACRLAWVPLPDGIIRQVVEVAERFADGEAASQERERTQELAEQRAAEVGMAFWAVWGDPRGHHGRTGGAKYLHRDVTDLLTRQESGKRGRVGKAALQAARHRLCNPLRDVAGNPFRPVKVRPRWRTEPVVTLATGIYEERAFDRMPILADALEEAGCDNRDVLDHCRGPVPHVRGCWVVDLILGKV